MFQINSVVRLPAAVLIATALNVDLFAESTGDEDFGDGCKRDSTFGPEAH